MLLHDLLCALTIFIHTVELESKFMYESFYGLTGRPFSMTPDSPCFAKIGSARETFDSLARCLEYGEGVAIVTGATGSGKSLLCLALEAKLKNQFETAYLAGGNFSSYLHFMKTVLTEVEEPAEGVDPFELQNRFQSFAKKSQRHCGGIVLLIDEAQSLDEETCMGLRVISNWNARGKPLVRILLCGNWKFEELLMSPELEFLNERVGAHAILESFSRQETSAYIDFRIRHFGGRTIELFEDESIEAICRVCKGIPKVINMVCDRSLLIAFENGEKPVSVETIVEAVEKLKHLPVQLNELVSSEEEIPSSDLIELEPISTEIDSEVIDSSAVDSNTGDDSESFVFEVGESEGSFTKPEQHERTATPSKDDAFAEEESFAFETESSREPRTNREWESMNETLIDSNNAEIPNSVESIKLEDGEIENELIENSSMEDDAIQIVEISGDSDETEESPFHSCNKLEISVPDSIPDSVPDTEPDIDSNSVSDKDTNTIDVESISGWKKIPVDLRWNDSTTSTLSPSDSVTSKSDHREISNRFEPRIEVTASQNYARIRPEQLLQKLVMEGVAENCEGIESDSSWLRHNDTKLFDCIANDPISYRDDTYHRMKDDYEHSPELIEHVSSVANTSCETEVARALMSLLEEIDSFYSSKQAVALNTEFQAIEKESKTYSHIETPTHRDDASFELYDTVLPENTFEEQEASSLSRRESQDGRDLEIPRLEETDENQYIVSDLYRRDPS